MIKNTTEELHHSEKVYDVDIEINDKFVVVEVEIEQNNIIGLEVSWKIRSRSDKLTSEEVEEINNFIRNKYEQ